MSKLNLDRTLVTKARAAAQSIAKETQEFVDRHTTEAVERTVLRLFGIDGVDALGVPLANRVVEQIMEGNALGQGVALHFVNGILETGMDPQALAESVAAKETNLLELPMKDSYIVELKALELASARLEGIRANRRKREERLTHFGDKTGPLLYVIVATGNIHEDMIQAKAAARQGADVIAVIRTTGQSLLDYVPYGATTEGFGGTFATQENFRLMREALDQVGEEVGRYIRLCNYCSGLCMPEIAAMGAMERLDVMLNDALYGILFRDINMKRTMVDQYFSRMINAFAGVVINTGEDNYLTTADAYEEAHTVLASQFINEQFALMAGLPEEQMGLGHAFEIAPTMKNGFLYELAQAEMAREIFPNAPLKYMPPTKFKTGDIFMGQVQDALFNMVTVLTGQRIHLLGMITEAIHTPFMSDRALSIENARYIFNTMEDLGAEIVFREDGILQKRAQSVLEDAVKILDDIHGEGLFHALEQGRFANIRRAPDGGKGLSGVVEKETGYFNPFLNLMKEGGRSV